MTLPYCTPYHNHRGHHHTITTIYLLLLCAEIRVSPETMMVIWIDIIFDIGFAVDDEY